MDPIEVINKYNITALDMKHIMECVERTLNQRESARKCSQKKSKDPTKEPVRQDRDIRLEDILYQYKYDSLVNQRPPQVVQVQPMNILPLSEINKTSPPANIIPGMSQLYITNKLSPKNIL